MADPILAVWPKDEHGSCLVTCSGIRLGYLSEPMAFSADYEYSVFDRCGTSTTTHIQLVVREGAWVPTPPEQKRKWSTVMGLRKPKGNDGRY